MGTATSTGSTGDETVKGIKQAIIAMQEGEGDAPPRAMTAIELARALRKFTRSIRHPFVSGAKGFESLAAFQNLLLEHEEQLGDAKGYIQGGFESYADARGFLAKHCINAARAEFDRARFKGRFIADQISIDYHPVKDLEVAYSWIRQSGLPLFADKTYAPLGVTRAQFFERLQNAHVDAVRQKLRICKSLAQSGADDERAYELIDEVMNEHLEGLGVSNINYKIARRFQATASDIDDLYRVFAMRRFKSMMAATQVPQPHLEVKARPVVAIDAFRAARDNTKAIAENHMLPYGSEAWHQHIIMAGQLILPTDTLRDVPETYEGTPYTKEQFQIEFDKSVTALIRARVEKIMTGNVTPTELEKAFEMFESLRSLYPKDAPKPDDVDPFFQQEDYWLHPVMKEFKLRSYTHLINECRVVSAAARTSAALQNEGADVVEVHDELMKAQGLFRAVGFPVDHPHTLKEVNLDYDALNTALVHTAPYAANRDWSLSFLFAASPQEALDSLYDAGLAREQLLGMHEEALLEFTDDQLYKRRRLLETRRIEETLADSQICLPGDGIYNVLIPVFETLKDQRRKLDDPQLCKTMGLGRDQARAVTAYFDEHDVIERWQTATDDDADPFERLEQMRAVRAITAGMTKAQQAKFSRAAEVSLKTIDMLIKEQALALYKQTMVDVEDNCDDPLKVNELLRDAAMCLKAAHPMALKSDIVFRRLTGGNRAKFIADFNTAGERVRRLMVLPAERRHWRKDAAQILANVVSPRLTGEQAFSALAGLSNDLHGDLRSIMDPKLLERARLTPSSLHDFAHQQAMRAAKDCVAEAKERMDNAGAIGTLKEHSYESFRKTLHWITFSGHNPMDDAPWRELGFADRAEFIQTMRGSLQDLVGRLEHAVVTKGLDNGPVTFLTMLGDLADAYEILGQDPKGARREAMRGAVRDMANAAVSDILELKAPPVDKTLAPDRQKLSASRLDRGLITKQYRMMTALTRFINKVDNGADIAANPRYRASATQRKRDYVGRINANVVRLVFKRVEKALALWDKRPGQPGRGAALASAIGDLRELLPEAHLAEFDKLFEPHGFTTYDGFAYHTGLIQLRTVARRINAVAKTAKPTGSVKPYLAVLRDLDRIEDMIKVGLFDARERVEMFKSMGLADNWMIDIRRGAAMNALPHLARATSDPTLLPGVRWEMLDQCFRLGEYVGTDMREELGIDWQAMERQRTQMLYASAATQLMADQMRGSWDCLSADMVSAEATLNGADASLADPAIAESLRIPAGEAAQLAALIPYIPAYNALTSFRRTIFTGGGSSDIHPHLVAFFEGCRTQKIDPTAPATFTALGIDAQYHETVIDKYTIEVLAAMHRGTLGAIERTDAAQAKLQFDACLSLMDGSKIEERYDDNALVAAGAMTRKMIIAGLPAVTPPPPSKPKAP